jgi:hypothetical protein
MDIQNKETAIHSEQQLEKFDDSKILSDIETHLKSIADSLNKITENGLEIFEKSWR